MLSIALTEFKLHRLPDATGAPAPKIMCAPELFSGEGPTRPLFSPAFAGVFLYGRPRQTG